MRPLLVVLFACSSIAYGNLLDSFSTNGIEFEVYGEGRLVPEKQNCVPYTLDLNDLVNSFNNNSMNEYSRGLLQKRIFTSFDAICRKFRLEVDQETPVYNLTEDRTQMRYLDYFDYNWNSLRFERDLKSLFLEHKINNPFLESIGEETIRRAGAMDVQDFSMKTTVFPKKCNVKQMTLDTMLCFNISDTRTQSGTIYALAHGGEFLHNEEVYAYYDIPQFALITTDAIIPIELEKCKVLFGTYIYCFEEFDTQCDVRTLSDCPIYAYKTDDDFVFRRNFGIGSIYATTESEVDLYQNGTRQVVPGRVFVLRTSYGTPNSENGEPVMLPQMTPHYEPANSQFAELLPESMKVLNANKPTRLYKTQRRGKEFLSHKHFDQGAWDTVRDFFGF